MLRADDIVQVRSARAVGRPRDMPYRLTLQVTNMCNHHCRSCGIWRIYRDPDGRESPRSELSAAQWVSLASRAFDQGVETIDVTGGEPFLKQDIEDLMQLSLCRSGFSCVTTNALQCDATAARIESVLARAPAQSLFVVSVSLDGFEETHDRLRGVRGAYAKAIRLLGLLRDLRRNYPQLCPSVSFTIVPDNCKEMGSLLSFLLGQDIIRTPDDFSFRPANVGHYYRTGGVERDVESLEAEIRQVMSAHRFTRNRPFFSGLRVHVRRPERMLLPCFALFASCWIDPYGNVAPCVSMTETTFGNVMDHGLDLRELWHGERARTLRKQIASDACPVCWTDCQAHENILFNGHDSTWMPAP
jgi:radical SAM protein with 4Fe4S-binding SPASM domain